VLLGFKKGLLPLAEPPDMNGFVLGASAAEVDSSALGCSSCGFLAVSLAPKRLSLGAENRLPVSAATLVVEFSSSFD
jgi:hypothetical protein